mmetsp:Transcript_11201/g.26422  ORF Transcript_11201/g.26422 Transcript_11201/m.26422 type:complete len:575 (-) Transcript_11201:147-1871(-)
MPLVPHPPAARSDAIGQKAGLPTLNFVKLKQNGLDLDAALSSRGNTTARGRAYAAQQGGAQQSGQAAAQPSKPPSQPANGYGATREAPHRRQVLSLQGGAAAQGQHAHLMPHPPPGERVGTGGSAEQNLPDRNKQEPAYPLTARNPTSDKHQHQEQAARQPALTARGAIEGGGEQPESQNLAPQKYDEVSKANASGGSNVPLTPAAALKLYMNSMTLYEQGEILDYPQVFYVGANAQKQRPTADTADNHGFDDERGDYLWVMHDHVSFRYEILGVLGKGSFGVVTKCYDWKTNQLVALKVIRNKKRFHHQALVEVKLLEHLRDHDTDGNAAIVHMRDYFYFRNHMCITFELLCINLYEFIKNNKFQGLSLGLIRRIAVQLLLSLRFLRKLRVIHCDLKPENVLIRSYSRCEIKIIDFGSSCFITDHLTSYVQSRSYRAPEVILGLPYDHQIDMWSLGCILAELWTGRVLFQNDSLATLLARVVGILGSIDENLLLQGRYTHRFFTKHKILYDRMADEDRSLVYIFPKRSTLKHRLGTEDPLFLNFLEKLLTVDPAKRSSAEAALQHPWLAKCYV